MSSRGARSMRIYHPPEIDPGIQTEPGSIRQDFLRADQATPTAIEYLS